MGITDIHVFVNGTLWGASSKSEPRKFKLEEALGIPLVLTLFSDKSGAERKYMCPEEVRRVGEGGES